MSELTLPVDFKNGPVCGVLSVAICSNLPYAKVWAAFASRRPKRWAGGTNVHERIARMKELGVAFRVAKDFHREGGLPTGRLVWKRYFPTVKTAVAMHTVPGRTYSFTTGHHVVTVRDGIVIDQMGPKPVAEHWTRRQRVEHIIEFI